MVAEFATEQLLRTVSLVIGTSAVTALVVYHWLQRHITTLREHNAALATRLEAERDATGEKHAAMEQARAQLAATFSMLSHQALRNNNEQFLRLARAHLGEFQVRAQAGLEQKEQAVAHLVQPIREALERAERQIQRLEQERCTAFGSLSKHLETMAQVQNQLQLETRNLVQALRRPEVRGQWGELTLRRLAELAGMVEHCDFYEQEQHNTAEGALRPDMVVRMPDAREIVVDVKTPLDAYLSALSASDDAERRKALERHARNVRDRVRELAAKSYWAQFPNAPDFVVLFIPGDQFLSAALEIDPGLFEDALRQKVILATPTSLIALLRAVAYGWRQQAVAEHAQTIRDLGEELFRRLGAFTEHLAHLGKSLGGSVESYNRAVGSLERQVLPGARRLTELGVSGKKPLQVLEPLETAVRRSEGS